MSDRALNMTNIFVGALLGGALGYLCLTQDGRRLLSRAEPWLDEMMEQMKRVQAAAAKAREAVDEGRHSFGAVLHAAGHGEQRGGGVSH